MANGNEQDTTTGSTAGKRLILASEKQSTEAESKPSRKPTSTAEGSTKPVSVTEALSLLQTLCLDLQSLDCKTAILARGNAVYFYVLTPASIGSMTFEGGHIRADGVPVSDIVDA